MKKYTVRFIDGDGERPEVEIAMPLNELPIEADRVKVKGAGPFRVALIVRRYGAKGLLGIDLTYTRKTMAQWAADRRAAKL